MSSLIIISKTKAPLQYKYKKEEIINNIENAEFLINKETGSPTLKKGDGSKNILAAI